MSRFEKVVRLAYECFKDKIGDSGGVFCYNNENYIEILINLKELP